MFIVIVNQFKKILNQIKSFISNRIKIFFRSISTRVKGILIRIKNVFNPISSRVKGILIRIKNVFSPISSRVKGILARIRNVLVWIKDTRDYLKAYLKFKFQYLYTSIIVLTVKGIRKLIFFFFTQIPRLKKKVLKDLETKFYKTLIGKFFLQCGLKHNQLNDYLEKTINWLQSLRIVQIVTFIVAFSLTAAMFLSLESDVELPEFVDYYIEDVFLENSWNLLVYIATQSSRCILWVDSKIPDIDFIFNFFLYTLFEAIISPKWEIWLWSLPDKISIPFYEPWQIAHMLDYYWTYLWHVFPIHVLFYYEWLEFEIRLHLDTPSNLFNKMLRKVLYYWLLYPNIFDTIMEAFLVYGSMSLLTLNERIFQPIKKAWNDPINFLPYYFNSIFWIDPKLVLELRGYIIRFRDNQPMLARYIRKWFDNKPEDPSVPCPYKSDKSYYRFSIETLEHSPESFIEWYCSIGLSKKLSLSEILLLIDFFDKEEKGKKKREKLIIKKVFTSHLTVLNFFIFTQLKANEKGVSVSKVNQGNTVFYKIYINQELLTIYDINPKDLIKLEQTNHFQIMIKNFI